MHFVFMATKATLLDTSLRILEVAKMYSSILLDLLVMLAMVFIVMPPGSPWNWSTTRL